MSSFEEQLNAILTDPQAMAQIADLAQSLQSGNGEDSGCSDAFPHPLSQEAVPNNASLDLSSLLGQFDPTLIGRLLPLIGEITDKGGSNERIQLLHALRPFLKPERQEKVERAIKLAKLIHVGKKLLLTMGDSDV